MERAGWKGLYRPGRGMAGKLDHPQRWQGGNLGPSTDKLGRETGMSTEVARCRDWTIHGGGWEEPQDSHGGGRAEGQEHLWRGLGWGIGLTMELGRWKDKTVHGGAGQAN